MRKLCYIGHFGGNEVLRNGQTIKTKNIADALETSGVFRIKYVDTYYYKKNLLKFCVQLVSGLLSSKQIILSVADGGRRIFFPLLYCCAKLFGKKVYHFLIGGKLAEETQANRKWNKYLQSFCVNWVESHLIVDDLKELGITNVEYLPNFKQLPVVSLDNVDLSQGSIDKFCIFSRIVEGKGITEAVDAVAQINQKNGGVIATLDLYGQLDPAYADTLETLLEEHSGYVRYCGEAEPEDSVNVLVNYDILLFPTRFYLEGIPGTIIDALCAGIPVIARQWKCCHEMLTHKYNGFCYDHDQPDKLVYWMEYAMEHPEEVFEMKKNCLLTADQYRTENVAPVFIRRLAE